MEKLRKFLAVLLKWLTPVLFAVCAYIAEERLSRQLYAPIVPFPEAEYWMRIGDCLLRDLLLFVMAWVLFLRRKRLPDRLRRYFPVAVTGAAYLVFAAYIVNKLELDTGVCTLLAVLAGLNNNVLPPLIAAMCYLQKTGSRAQRWIYFAVYVLNLFVLGVDAVYFWQTTMHIQGVFFRNLNVYAAEGVLSGFTLDQIVGAAVVAAVCVLLFRLPGESRHKPNFVWSLFCAASFTLLFNGLHWGADHLDLLALKTAGLWSGEQVEKSRQEYRGMLATAVTPNAVHKALFSKERATRQAVSMKKRELTPMDKRLMHKLGLLRDEPFQTAEEPAYDRIVMLILESVHRDYFHYYNPDKFPAECTPFVDSLLMKYPRLDNYYSSAVPTTEGLNATFRSQMLFDGDIPGEFQPSLFRSLQEHGYDGVFLSASSKYYNNEFHEYAEQFGMKEYYAREYMEQQGYKGASGWGFHNDAMYKETLRQLKKRRGEKFLWVTKTLDMHQPYPYYATAWEMTPESFRDNQIVTVHGAYWIDCTLRDFFDEARREGLMDDRTLFIITSDHNPHSGGEYLELVQNPADKQVIAPIPLIFVSKNLKPLSNLRTKEYASQIDLAPTLLCLLGIEPPKRFLGRNLLQRYDTPPCALGFFGDKVYYYSDDLKFVFKIDEPYPERDYEDSLANYVMWSYYRSSLPEDGQ